MERDSLGKRLSLPRFHGFGEGEEIGAERRRQLEELREHRQLDEVRITR